MVWLLATQAHGIRPTDLKLYAGRESVLILLSRASVLRRHGTHPQWRGRRSAFLCGCPTTTPAEATFAASGCPGRALLSLQERLPSLRCRPKNRPSPPLPPDRVNIF